MSLSIKRYRVIKIIAIFIGLDIVLSALITRQWIFAPHLDRPQKADAIVVLFHDYGHYYSMGNESLRRVHYGIKLFKEGYAPHMIFAGGSRPSHNIYGSKLMAHYVQECGVPPDRIHYEVKSNDSTSNWEESYKILKEYQWNSVLLVSSPLHLQRVRTLINHHGSTIYYVPVPQEGCDPPLTFFDHWISLHYNGTSYLSYCLLPPSMYRNLINMLRH